MSKAQRGGPGRPPGQEKTGGRPKGALNKNTAAIKEIAGKYGPEVIAGFIKMFRNSKDEDIKIRAGQELLNRGFGRPAQAVSVANPDGTPLDFNSMNLDQLVELATRLERTIAAATGPGSD